MKPSARLFLVTVLALGLPACSVVVPALDLPAVASDEGGDADTADPGEDPTPDPGPGTDEVGADPSPDDATADPGPGDTDDPDPGVDPGVDTSPLDPGGDDAAPVDPGGEDVPCVPSCEGLACTDDDGCGTPCGCAPGYECAPESAACIFTDWTAGYRGSFRVYATVQYFPLPDQEMVCQGALSVSVQVGSSPSVTGRGQCVSNVGTTSIPLDVDLQGEVFDRVRVQGVATYGSGSDHYGQAAFSGTFSGPSPRMLVGNLDGGPQFNAGLATVRFHGGDYDVVEAR